MLIGLECICSLHESTKQISIEFNLFQQLTKEKFNVIYPNKLLELGYSIGNIEEVFEKLSMSITLKDFDEEYLRPEPYKLFCSILNISITELLDEYYKFIFDDYSFKILNARINMKLNQKEMAKLLMMSPSDISKFEVGHKIPTRSQYIKLKKALTL